MPSVTSPPLVRPGPNVLAPGTPVEVWIQLTKSWSPGFVVEEVSPEGYVVRRRSDGRVLPNSLPIGSVRRLD